MRHSFTIFFVLLFSAVIGQANKTDAVVNLRPNEVSVKRTDSFVFASRSFPIPHDCYGKDASRCCSYESYPAQVSCGNGTGMVWDFFSSEEIAKQNADNWASKRDRKSVRKKEVTCYLLGKEVKGLQTNVVNRDGFRHGEIYVWGMVGGRAVLLTLSGKKEFKHNKDIPQVYQQILKLKSIP